MNINLILFRSSVSKLWLVLDFPIRLPFFLGPRILAFSRRPLENTFLFTYVFPRLMV